jgi:hypothetical protein
VARAADVHLHAIPSMTSLRPSQATRKGCLPLDTWSEMVLSWGSTIGRVVRVCGAIGVIAMTPEFGTSNGPPAASEYAVEPVGVVTITPSAQ